MNEPVTDLSTALKKAPRSVTRTADHHLPQFHIRLPRGYLNDPNGPIHDGERTHLYFQSRPRVDLDIPVEWGHATSTDLVHWTLHRPAIVPLPGGADSDGAWSGNTVIHDGSIRAYYSGKLSHSVFQSVLMAESRDGGNTYGPPVRVVDDPSAEEGVTMFRDPFVWRDGGGWSMGVGAATAGYTASIRHYRSTDAFTWRYVGDLAALHRTTVDGTDTGEGWECPQILTVDGTDIAVVSAWSPTDGPGHVLAFPLGGTPHPYRVDDGQNFYAASVMREGPWGPVLFGWITEGRTAEWTKQSGWSGAISLPRRAWLDAGRIGTEPHPAVDSLRVGAPRPARNATVGAQIDIVVPAPATGCVRLRFSATEYLDISIDAEANTVTIDRTNASSDARAHSGCAVAASAFDDSASRPAVRVLVDGSIVEVFTSAGRALTTRVYPTQMPPWVVECPAQALVWQLRASIGTHTACDDATDPN